MPARKILGSVLLSVLLLATTDFLSAQALAPPFPSWHPQLPAETILPSLAKEAAPVSARAMSSHGQSHTMTGLLIGGLVGAAATGVFLAGFCSGSDTHCGGDEVGTAAVIIALPLAVVGAIIGSLIRT
jgi:hypothetical protein